MARSAPDVVPDDDPDGGAGGGAGSGADGPPVDIVADDQRKFSQALFGAPFSVFHEVPP